MLVADATSSAVLQEEAECGTAEAAEREREERERLVAALRAEDMLPGHEGLKSGVLKNGLRYCIFPNKKPAGRFYVNLEINAGSADEVTQFTCFTGTKVQILTRLLSQEEHQRGLAHFLEHALFLGTEKFPSQKDMKQLLRR